MIEPVRKAMIPAARAARDGDWKRGTLLRSSKWKADRLVGGVSDAEVELVGRYASGNSSRTWVKLVPRDVEVVSLGEET